MDWLKIKTEYITTDISYRGLAEKYGIPKNRIAETGKKENWTELRVQFRDKTLTKTVEKTAEELAKKQAKQAAKVGDLADKLLIKLEQAIEELDQAMVTHKTKTREIKYEDASAPGKPTRETIREEEELLAVASVIDRNGLRMLTAALKDLKFIKDEISDLERREREARIEALRRSNLLGDEDDDETGVVLLPPRREVETDG